MKTSFSPTSVSAALRESTPTAQRKVAALLARLDFAQVGHTGPATLPGLDVAALQTKYPSDRGAWPRCHAATFRVPLDLSDAQYQTLRRRAVGQFLAEMDRRGWDVYIAPGHRPRITPGVCPARDLASGKDIPGTREMILRIWFRLRRPEAQRIEIPPHLLASRTVGG